MLSSIFSLIIKHSKIGYQTLSPNTLLAKFKDKVYNNPTSHKHAIAPLKHEMISKASDPLFSVLLLPTLQSPRWKGFTLALCTCCENCHKYIAYLEERAAVVQRNNPVPLSHSFSV